MFNINFCQWLDSNCGPLELEATALPTEPQPLPNDRKLYLYHTEKRIAYSTTLGRVVIYDRSLNM